MTKKILVCLGLMCVASGLLAPYGSHTMLSDFMSINLVIDWSRELLGFSMIIYALVPEFRTAVVRRIFMIAAVSLIVATAYGIWSSKIMLLDIFIYSSAAIYLLLGALELEPSMQKRFFRYSLRSYFKKTRPGRLYHAH